MPRGRKKKASMVIDPNSPFAYGLIVAVFLFGALIFNVTTFSGTRSFAAVGNVTYIVNQNGGGDFTSIQACANTADTGNTCLVKPGVYEERVTTVNAGVTFKAEGQVVMKGFYITRPNTTVDGFTIRRYASDSDDANQRAMIQIRKWRDDDGSSCRIVNNTIGPGVYAVANDYALVALTDTTAEITSNSVDFLSKGFRPGIEIYIGTRSYDAPLNHDLYAKVVEVSAHKLVVESAIPITLSSATIGTETHLPRDRAFRSDPQFLAVLFAIPHKEKGGVRAIEMDARLVSGSFVSPSNCYIGYNLITDHMAQQIQLAGDGHVVEHNEITGGHGFTAIAFVQGRNNTIRYNYIHDGHSPFTIDWIRNGQVDRNSGYYWDFSGNVIAYFAINQYAVFENNVVDHNFIMNIDDQLTKFDAYHAGERGLEFTNNVYVNIHGGSAGFSVNGMKVRDNIFYRAPYASNVTFPMSPSGGSNISQLVGMEVTNNVFLGIGDSDTNDSRGWYGTSNAEVFQDYNYIAGPVQGGYAAKDATLINQAHTINGGDPKFQNVNNPLGPDGRPWTSDDGLIPLSGSPLCGAGVGGTTIGPYECVGGSTNTGNTNTGTTGNTNTGSANTTNTTNTTNSTNNTGNTTNTTNTTSNTSGATNVTVTVNNYTPTYTSQNVPATTAVSFVPKQFSLVVKEGQSITIPLGENISATEILIDSFPRIGSLNVTERFNRTQTVTYTAPLVDSSGLDYFTYYIINANGERSAARGAVAISVQRDLDRKVTYVPPTQATAPTSGPTIVQYNAQPTTQPSSQVIIPVAQQSVTQTQRVETPSQNSTHVAVTASESSERTTQEHVTLGEVLHEEQVNEDGAEPGLVGRTGVRIAETFVNFIRSFQSLFKFTE